MKTCLFSVLIVLLCLSGYAAQRSYTASTPAHALVRDFLQISATDSIDFIRWNLSMDSGNFKLECRYGLSKPSTPGFSNEKRVSLDGQVSKTGNYYELKHQGKNIRLFEMNSNVLHFVDPNDRMLAGNGGYSFALNNIDPVEDDKINVRSVKLTSQNPMVFEGRTPCQDLSVMLGLNKGEACNKMKWYFLLYTDPAGNPSHFLMAGIGYVRKTMLRGTWKIVTEAGSKTTYQLSSDKWAQALNLLKADEDILFFTDAKGSLLVGNEDFSYTLNRRSSAYPPIKR